MNPGNNVLAIRELLPYGSAMTHEEWLKAKPKECRSPDCNPADAVEGLCCGWIECEPADPRDHDPSRPGIFRDHNCWACKDGAQPCREGRRGGLGCSYPHARND